MPEICRFYGIIIKMFYNDHNPPHFHAEYGDKLALVNIQTLAVFAGHLPPRALGLVTEWASLHQPELMGLWKKAREQKALGKVEPLN
jgi:hypothetical protein